MSCDVAKFTITKGIDNTFVFTIKADGSTLPMDVLNGTYTATLYSLETQAAVAGLTNVALTKLTPTTNGKVSLTIPSATTATLTGERGSKVDRYYLKPVYKLVINCVGTDNGDFIAKVPEVYVD